MARPEVRQLLGNAAPGPYPRRVSETPRNPADETAPEGPTAEDPRPTPDLGSSAFDEPTARIPLAEDRTASNPTEVLSRDTLAGNSTDMSDFATQAFPMAGAQVLSTESDFPDGEHPTQRIPTYEELSAPRREPQEVAAVMDEHLAEEAPAKRGTLDLGLLLIRVVLGVILFAHGLQKLTGWWGGAGIGGFETVLGGLGFDYAPQLAYAVPITEVVAGAMLVLGLLTPVAAAAAVAVLINAWAAVQARDAGFQFFASQNGGQGVELETMLLAAAAGLGLTGAGKISLDANRSWTRRPLWGSLTILLLGVIAGVAIWVVLSGQNPFA